MWITLRFANSCLPARSPNVITAAPTSATITQAMPTRRRSSSPAPTSSTVTLRPQSPRQALARVDRVRKGSDGRRLSRAAASRRGAAPRVAAGRFGAVDRLDELAGGVDAEPAQRFRLPARRAVARPTAGARGRCRARARGRRSCARRGSSCSRRRRRSRPPTRCPVARSKPTDGYQSRGTPTAPPHRCVIAASPSAGNSDRSVACSDANTRGSRSNCGPHARAEVVRRAAAAEREPAVGRALAVDDHVAEVGERRARVEPRLGPERVGQRLGRDHQRVDRRDRAPQARAAPG